MVIFISHADSDNAFVNKLRTELHLRDHTTWVDHFDTPPGAPLHDVINQALEYSSVMLFVVSNAALQSQPVRREWQSFLHVNKPIIPVKVQACVMPMLLNSVYFLDFIDEAQFRANLDRLLEALPSPDAGNQRAIPINIPISSDPSTEIETVVMKTGQTTELRRRAEGLNTDKLTMGEAKIILPEHDRVFPFHMSQSLLVGRTDVATGRVDIDLSPFGAAGRGVSRRHLMIQNTTEGMTITDLHSSNGTYIAHKKLDPHRPVLIRSKTLIRLGSFPLQIEYNTGNG
ncbi:MAG: TIR domain-containing protein [bacterium]|nr:TIR domain-containing protein [bacterium]